MAMNNHIQILKDAYALGSLIKYGTEVKAIIVLFDSHILSGDKKQMYDFWQQKLKENENNLLKFYGIRLVVVKQNAPDEFFNSLSIEDLQKRIYHLGEALIGIKTGKFVISKAIEAIVFRLIGV